MQHEMDESTDVRVESTYSLEFLEKEMVLRQDFISHEILIITILDY